MFLKNPERLSIIGSYIPKTVAKTPPLTPGIIAATPQINPFINFSNDSLIKNPPDTIFYSICGGVSYNSGKISIHRFSIPVILAMAMP